MAPQPSSTSTDVFKVDEKVLCYHGPMLYEAKVLDIDEANNEHPTLYKVHYKGWKNTWDEYVGAERLRKMTEENLRLQNELKMNGKPPAGSTGRGRPPNPDKAKKASSEETAANAAAARAKRNRELGLDDEEAFMNRSEIKLHMHDDFKALLVDDWENVTKNQQLVQLPKKPNVSEIINGYVEWTIKSGAIPGITDPKQMDSVNSAEKDVLEEFGSGMKLYFDKSLGNSLLYRFERQQFADILKEYPDSPMCEIYGAEHLLRLIVIMPELIAHTSMDQQSIGKLRHHIDSLLRYMQRDMKHFFSESYQNGTHPRASHASAIAEIRANASLGQPASAQRARRVPRQGIGSQTALTTAGGEEDGGVGRTSGRGRLKAEEIPSSSSTTTIPGSPPAETGAPRKTKGQRKQAFLASRRKK